MPSGLTVHSIQGEPFSVPPGSVFHKMKKFLFFSSLLLLAVTVGLLAESSGVSPQRVTPPSQKFWIDGNVEVFFDGDALEMVVETISEARRSIDMEMYLIGGPYGTRILRLLDQKARQGVHVRLIHSTSRSLQWAAWLKNKLPDSFIVEMSDHHASQPHYIAVADRLFSTELAESKIERAAFPLHDFLAKGFNPFRSPHDKIILIDKKIAIVGGMNLATAVSQNHDVLVKATGPAVQAVVNIFQYDWQLATTGKAQFPNGKKLFSPAEFKSDEGAKLQFKVTRPHCENQYATILEAIDKAKQRVWIQMYCLTDTGIIEKAISARKRGVDVRFILDANEYTLGLRLRGAPNLAFCQQYLNNGISVRIYRSAPGHQMHQKTMLVDSDILMVGATNYTRQSFRVNTESMFVIKSLALAKTFEKRFIVDWEFCSDKPDPKMIASNRYYYQLVRLVSRYL